MTRPQAVLLDVDDTLLDTTAAIVGAASAAIGHLWPALSAQDVTAAAVRFRADPSGSFRRFTTGASTFTQMRSERLGEVAQHLGLDVGEGTIETFERVYRPAFLDSQRVFDDVPGFLGSCRAAGLAVGALTNAAATVTADKLQRVGGEAWFDVVVTRDTLGYGKPDPRVFERACADLGVSPQETLMVGDEWEPDVLGPLTAGLAACWLRRGPDAVDDVDREAGARVPEEHRGRLMVVSGLTELGDRLDLGTGVGDR